MRRNLKLALLWVSAGCSGVIGYGVADPSAEEIELRKQALVVWEFRSNGDTGTLEDEDKVLYSNPNRWNRVVVGLLPAGGETTPRLGAVAIDSTGKPVLARDGDAAHELPLKIMRKPLERGTWDLRVLNQHNLVVYRKYYAGGQEVPRPASTTAQGAQATSPGAPSAPASPALSPPSPVSSADRDRAIAWTFDALGNLLWKERIWLTKPDQPAQRAAIATLLGSDVCPDAALSKEELGSNQFPSVRGKDFENQPLVNKNNHWNVNLSLFFNRLKELSLEQPFTDEQRAAVLCTLSFFAIEHLRRTHNAMDFVKPWNLDFTRALQQAELGFYGSIQKSMAPAQPGSTGSAAQSAGSPPMRMEECVSNANGPTPNNPSPPQTTPENPSDLPPQPQTPPGTGSNGSPQCQEAPPVSSPLVIDLDDRGLILSSLPDGVRFDLLGNGHPVTTGWVRSGALLALDLDRNGRIESGAELFGEATTLPDGTRARDGFAALAQYDTRALGGNRDGRIDRKDALFARLLLWQDHNHDGLSQPAELTPLAQSGVESISLVQAKSDFPAARSLGNQVRLQGSVQLRSGARCPIYDVWFAYAPSMSDLFSLRD